jgi:hypothetical protein
LNTLPFQATSKNGKEAGIELIQPPPGSRPGERIYFEGAEFESEQSCHSHYLDSELMLVRRYAAFSAQPQEKNL